MSKLSYSRNALYLELSVRFFLVSTVSRNRTIDHVLLYHMTQDGDLSWWIMKHFQEALSRNIVTG